MPRRYGGDAFDAYERAIDNHVLRLRRVIGNVVNNALQPFGGTAARLLRLWRGGSARLEVRRRAWHVASAPTTKFAAEWSPRPLLLV